MDMQILMDLLRLGDAEADTLARFGPQMLERAQPFALHYREQLTSQPPWRGDLRFADARRLQRLMEAQGAHYIDLLTSTDEGAAQRHMHDLGELYFQMQLPQLWIMTSSSLLAADFEVFAAELTLDERRPLMGALYKRLRRDEVWQMQGFQQAQELAQADRAEHALRDSVTGLFNRGALDELLPIAMQRAAHLDMKLGLAVAELDDFEPLRRAMSREQAKAVLRQFGIRLRKALRGTDLIARMGRGRFAMVLDGLRDQGDLETVLDRVDAELALPYEWSEQTIWQMPASIGATLYPDDDSAPDALLQHAVRAMLRARAGRVQGAPTWRISGQDAGPVGRMPGAASASLESR